MITTLMVLVLLLTALLAMSLPWGGWGSGMDAAGRGMAMFFPMIFMLFRIVCLTIAVIVLAYGGALNWSGLPRFASGALAVLVVGGMGLSSFLSVERLAREARAEGRPQLAFLATMAGPLALVIWIFAERYGPTDPLQAWAMRALVLLLAVAPIPLFLRMNRQDIAARTAADAKAAADEAASVALAAAAVPEGAQLGDILRVFDAMDEKEWRARALVMERATGLPDLQAQLTALLSDPDLSNRIAASMHVDLLTPQPADYFEKIRPIIEEIVQRLKRNAAPPEVLHRESLAAIRMSWPAMHTTALPHALMQAFHEAVLQKCDDSRFANLQHDVKLLAGLIHG